MSFASAATMAAVLGWSVVATQGKTEKQATPPAPPPAPTLGAANVEKLSRLVRAYYFDLDNDSLKDSQKNAKRDLDKLVDEAVKTAKTLKIADPLLALDDWREITRRGLLIDKPTVNVTGRGELKDVAFASPIDEKVDAKELKDVYDGRLKALVSVPADFAKVAYPVIVGLHPTEVEENKPLAKIRKYKEVFEAAKAWATATYSKEFLAKAIVVVPILDYTRRSSDGISFSRPAWNTDLGVRWSTAALREIVFQNLNYDCRRVFFDGAGMGAVAAVDFCSRFPGLQTGAIVRGPFSSDADLEVRFENAAGTPMLFVGGEKAMVKVKVEGEEKEQERVVPFARSLLDKFKPDERFSLTWKETLDDASLLAWIGENSKVFAPKRIKLRATELKYSAAFWISVRDVDPNLENDPILLDAVIDREKNEITVVTNKKVKEFVVFFNDEVLDLSREVRILHRLLDDTAEPHERFKGILKRVIEDAVLASYKLPFNNTGEVYVASKLIEIR